MYEKVQLSKPIKLIMGRSQLIETEKIEKSGLKTHLRGLNFQIYCNFFKNQAPPPPFKSSVRRCLPREPAVRMDGWMLCKIKKLDNQFFLYNKR